MKILKKARRWSAIKGTRKSVKKKGPNKGQYEELVFRDFTDEERKILEMERDKYKVIQAQIDRLSIQEMRLVGNIEAEDADMTDDEDGQGDKRKKQIQEYVKELANVQKLKAQSVKLLHDMSIDDIKHGLAENADVQAAQKTAREVLEALSGHCEERGGEQ